MSSYHPRHLHPHGKRPFEDMPSSIPSPESRNKRARSTSSTSTESEYNTAQSSSRSDLVSDVPSTSDVHMSDQDSLRTSLQRFAAFDRQIAALRTSLASDEPAQATLALPPTFGSLPRYPPYPSYRPSPGASSPVAHDPAAGSALMHENATRGSRSSLSLQPSAPPSHIRRGLSPLVLPPDPTLFADAPLDGSRHIDPSPRPESDQSRLSQNRLHNWARVVREHPLEREAVPTVFDVFNIGEPSQEHNPAPFQFYTTEPLPPRAHSVQNAGPVPITANAGRQDTHSRPNGSWSSIPSSNSLMSESASERRQALALERFRARFREPTLGTADDSDSRWSAVSQAEHRESNVSSPVPQSPFTEFISQDWLEDPSERERQTEWEPHSLNQGRSLAMNWTSEDSLRPPPVPTPSRPSLGQGPSTATTNNGQSYSYSNLNLSSFQSGMFRDSLRRNAEVDQPPFSGRLMIPYPSTEDSGSDMDLDDYPRPHSPEWYRLRYAGHTPPPDYSPPHPTFSRQPDPRRYSDLGFDNSNRSQPANRNTFARPLPPMVIGPTSYENNDHRPATSDRIGRNRFIPARILESIYPSHEDGRRNTSAGIGQPYQHPQNHTPPNRNERTEGMNGPRSANNRSGSGTTAVSENRRSSLGLGSSLRSRFARFANPNGQPAPTNEPAVHQRSPSHPIGARPPIPEQHRRRLPAFTNTNAFERDRPGHWNVDLNMNDNGNESSMTGRDVPWRASPTSSSGPRTVFGHSPPPSGRVGTEEHPSRLRTLRQRFQSTEGLRAFRPGLLRAAIGRRGNLGDYVPDELFDDSYEALLSLSSMMGEVRSKATPEDVIACLPTGTFGEWKRDDSETRCPICLDDYESPDVLTKLVKCTHWLHKHCLEQWLRTANTCPVCREKVETSPKPAPARRRPHRDSSSPPETNQNAGSRAGRTAPAERPVSLATMVFNQEMDEGEPWTAPPAPSGARDGRDAPTERSRPQQPRVRELVFPAVPPPASPSGSRTGPLGLGFPRGQSDGGASSNSNVFSQSGFESAPTMVISSSTESSREWRYGRGVHDRMFTMGSRSSSSESSSSSMLMPQARPMNVANRIPIDEEGSVEDGWFHLSSAARGSWDRTN